MPAWDRIRVWRLLGDRGVGVEEIFSVVEGRGRRQAAGRHGRGPGEELWDIGARACLALGDRLKRFPSARP
jgi:hypothetical protein